MPLGYTVSGLITVDQCITLIAEAEFEEQTRSVIKVIQYERETL